MCFPFDAMLPAVDVSLLIYAVQNIDSITFTTDFRLDLGVNVDRGIQSIKMLSSKPAVPNFFYLPWTSLVSEIFARVCV